jgi:uncharacterized protein YaiI (UPF0178 family)
MRILVDADACPVVAIVEETANNYPPAVPGDNYYVHSA